VFVSLKLSRVASVISAYNPLIELIIFGGPVLSRLDFFRCGFIENELSNPFRNSPTLDDSIPLGEAFLD
jgi:hypothetical protein